MLEPELPEPAETSEERLAALLGKSRSLPAVPGVYLMKDAKGVVIYVGKASRLPDRVSSYFIPSADLGPRKQPMLSVVVDFDFLECESEWEALLAESRLIKDIKPRFNALQSDDKTYPYLVVTVKEDYPRIAVTRTPTDEAFRGARIFGPFVRPGALREAVQYLQRVFKFRTCSLDIIHGEEKNKRFRPCLLYNIGQCSAPCAERISPEAYRSDIDRFVKVISSKRGAMLREMHQDMNAAAQAMEYEKAAAIRDQIRALERLEERATISHGYQPETEIDYRDPAKAARSLRKLLGLSAPARCIEGIDIAHLQGGETVGSKVCFVDGRPFKTEYRRYRIETAGHAGNRNDDFASIREVVSRRYREAGAGQELYPDIILIDGGIGQLNAALDAFSQLGVRPPLVLSLAKKEELLYVQNGSEPIKLSRRHAGLRLLQQVRDEAHRFAQAYHHVLRRKRTLGES